MNHKPNLYPSSCSSAWFSIVCAKVWGRNTRRHPTYAAFMLSLFYSANDPVPTLVFLQRKSMCDCRRIRTYEGISQRIAWYFQVRRLNHSARQPQYCSYFVAENARWVLTWQNLSPQDFRTNGNLIFSTEQLNIAGPGIGNLQSGIVYVLYYVCMYHPLSCM